jgi:hypothetical protein
VPADEPDAKRRPFQSWLHFYEEASDERAWIVERVPAIVAGRPGFSKLDSKARAVEVERIDGEISAREVELERRAITLRRDEADAALAGLGAA